MSCASVCLIMIRAPTRFTSTDTLVPSTTRFRSVDPQTHAVKRYPLTGERGNANLNTAPLDGNGKLGFTGQNGIYGRVDPDTGKVDVWDAPRGRGPYGIATTPSGQVWYASLAGNHIARIDTESGKATVVESPTPGQGARRVWPDSHGRLWVS